MLTRGQQLAGRYEVLRPLGRGGMGGVFLARHLEVRAEVAIKELLLEGLDPARVEALGRQFRNEARILRGLRHPHLPAVYDFFEQEGRQYLVMEYIQGPTLQGVLDSQGPVPEAQALAWGRELCAVLAFLHGQDPPVLFRDLKPANVMVDASGHLKLIDFGIARSFQPEGGVAPPVGARGAGTAGYAAPEQHGGASDVRTEIYSLGATLYALLSGRTPPPSLELASGTVRLEDLRRVNPRISERTARAVAAMMSVDRARRPGSLREVRALLDAPAGLPAKAGPGVRTLLVLLVLLALAALAAFLEFRSPGSPPGPSLPGAPGTVSPSPSPTPGAEAPGYRPDAQAPPVVPLQGWTVSPGPRPSPGGSGPSGAPEAAPPDDSAPPGWNRAETGPTAPGR